VKVAIVASSSSPNNHASVYSGLVQGTLSHLSEAFANATKALEQILGSNQVSHGHRSGPPATDHLLAFFPPAVADFISSRTPFENTSIALALSALLILTMSWASRFGNLGRFSPFAREPPKGPSTVSDADFSYITSDDLRRFDAESQQNEDLGPARNTDVLKLKNDGRLYEVHFPAYSIAKGDITVGGIRDHAAKKIGVSDPQRVKLLVKGKTLLDDSRTAKSANIRHDDTILCVTPEGAESDSDDDEDDGEDSSALEGEGTTKKRRNRGKKTKRRNKREAQNTPAAVPTTPIGKLDALRAVLETFIPQCQAFEASPPADPAKRTYEHKRISETILTQVLLKIDAVETDGDAEARARRKELVRETQDLLTRLDQVEKS
jgi:hypothetical protein